MRSHSYHVFGPRINAWWFASRRVSWTESMNQFRESMIRERMKISKPCYRLFLDTFLIVVCVIELFWWKPQAENSKGHILIQYVDWFHITNVFPRFGSLWTSLRQSFSCLFGLFHQHQKVFYISTRMSRSSFHWNSEKKIHLPLLGYTFKIRLLPYYVSVQVICLGCLLDSVLPQSV